jgi:hypothetical protein
MFIIGMVRTRYAVKVHPLIDEANSITSTYMIAHSKMTNPPRLRDAQISYSTAGNPALAGAPKFNDYLNMQLYYYGQGSSGVNGLPVGVADQNNIAFITPVFGKISNGIVELSSWPPTLEITYDFTDNPQFAQYYVQTPSSISIDMQP